MRQLRWSIYSLDESIDDIVAINYLGRVFAIRYSLLVLIDGGG